MAVLQITKQTTETLAQVAAYPEEVIVTVLARDGAFTPDDALELGKMILIAVETSKHLTWRDPDSDDMDVIDDRDADG